MDRFIRTKGIHIMGGAGSGKTTLARLLGERLGFPYYHLDEIAYERGAGRKIPLNDRMESIRAILAQPGWITEGSFLWWTDPLLEAADIIIWLDLPFRITGWRIVKRHVQLSWAGTNRHPGTIKLLRFLYGVYNSRTSTAAIIPTAPDDDEAMTRIAEVEFVSKWSQKVVRCRQPADVAKVTAEILGNDGEKA